VRRAKWMAMALMRTRTTRKKKQGSGLSLLA
jgi:hypothetical protein